MGSEKDEHAGAGKGVRKDGVIRTNEAMAGCPPKHYTKNQKKRNQQDRSQNEREIKREREIARVRASERASLMDRTED